MSNTRESGGVVVPELVLVALLDKEKQRFNREYANGQRTPIRAAEDGLRP
jgi:hypothetical protein